MINKYGILNGAKCFSSEGLQSYLVFTSTNKYLSFFRRPDKTYSSECKGMSKESIKNQSTSDNSFAPKFIDTHPLPKVKSNGN